MANENLEKQSTSLNNNSKNMDTLSDDLGAVLTASEEDNDNIKKGEVSGGENGSNTGGTIENYEENLGILIDQYIQDKEVNGEVARAFKKFCEVECGWMEELPIDIVNFMQTLRAFNEKILPEYRKYVKIDEKYLK